MVTQKQSPKKISWLVLLLPVSLIIENQLAAQDTLARPDRTNSNLLMNDLFGISESRLQYCFYPDLVNNERQEEISNVQKKLKSGEVMLEYFLTDTTLGFFFISNTVFSLYYQPISFEFWQIITDYRKKLRLADIHDQAMLSHLLYLRLVAPVKEMLHEKRRLIIIPGKELLGIPFEALIVEEQGLRKPPQYNQYHYLIQDFEITYHYSARLWIESVPGNRPCEMTDDSSPVIDFTGFSPVDFQNPGIPSLPFSGSEVLSIACLFQQKGYSISLSSSYLSKESSFMEIAGRSRVIHLASHVHTDPVNPESGGIIFWDFKSDGDHISRDDGILSFREAASLKLKADLMVLNTCSSGAFTRKGNAGVISLPMGFVKAGVKNILSTLWDVTDRLAFQIVIGFYRKWLSGKTFSEALREVKLELIKCRETSLPTVWASYILIGH